MSDNGSSGVDSDKSADPRIAKLVYVLYLIGVLFGPLILIGVAIAYVQNDTGPKWLNSHYRFQIRTFWLGIISFLIIVVVAFGGLAEVSGFYAFIGLVFAVYFVIWWLVRSTKGYKRVSKRNRMNRPEAFGFGD